MRHFATALAAALLLALPALSAHAQDLSVGAADTVQPVLQAHKGNRVTVRLTGGQELTGVVREATAKLVALGALTDHEFFDAAVPLEKVEAVLVRTKQ
ncbi:MAG: hypothetical protein O3A06_03520 [Proteobacteria bacterium]|nr:hypothetical protein [Pseudomonadota bacterium]